MVVPKLNVHNFIVQFFFVHAEYFREEWFVQCYLIPEEKSKGWGLTISFSKHVQMTIN